MTARLASGLWVQAYLARLGAANLPAYVLARGDETAGAVAVKSARLDGTARVFERSLDLMTGARTWIISAEGAEPDVDAYLARARSRDPDLWVIEVESRAGQTLLDEAGLAD